MNNTTKAIPLPVQSGDGAAENAAALAEDARGVFARFSSGLIEFAVAVGRTYLAYRRYQQLASQGLGEQQAMRCALGLDGPR